MKSYKNAIADSFQSQMTPEMQMQMLEDANTPQCFTIYMIRSKLIANLEDTEGGGLRDAEVRRLLVGVRAGGGVDLLLAEVGVGGPVREILGHILELEQAGVLLDVGQDGLRLADGAALGVVGVLVKAAGALDRGGEVRVVVGAAGDDNVEAVVAARGAAEAEVGHLKGAGERGVAGDWDGTGEGGGGNGDDGRGTHVDGWFGGWLVWLRSSCLVGRCC